MSLVDLAFGFSGRIGRLKYLCASLLVLALIEGLKLVGPLLPFGVGLGLAIIILILALWVVAAFTVKRLHDIGLAGTNAVWFILLSVADQAVRSVPILSAVTWLVGLGAELWLVFQPGQYGPNRYGDPPT
jgi:uncharacterized membrane protein YhaH (DUF805 family)